MNFYFDRPEEVPKERIVTMKKAAELTVRREGLDPDLLEVSVSFVSPEEIRSLNSQYRNVDRVTDVLSFPQFESEDEIRTFGENFGMAELGDVVICPERAAEQAEQFGHSEEREIIYLFVHSMLHLLGYDHMEADEKKEMRTKEEEIMTILGIPRESAKNAGEETGKVLFQKAMDASLGSWSPYSGFRVGAAIQAMNEEGDTEIFTGANVENISYGGTICAERAAAVKAVNAGYRIFVAGASCSPDGTASPCGICRQFLSEFGPDMVFFFGPDEDHLKRKTLSELLPGQFRVSKASAGEAGRYGSVINNSEKETE